VIVGLALAGCGNGSAFAQGMIPQHQQAVEMARLAAERSQHPQVRDLAARIRNGQDPEIASMTGWLREWGAAPPTTGMGHGNMDHGGKTGMMTPEQMTQLENANGVAFDRMFLEMMTEHHRGAIEMADTELAQGADPRATQLPKAIVDAQRGEISEMATLQTQLR
jgi:uncharacterized protein (DUF305 family)